MVCVAGSFEEGNGFISDLALYPGSGVIVAKLWERMISSEIEKKEIIITWV